MASIKKLLHLVTPPFVLSWYHFVLACIGACMYWFPSSAISVIVVTGTKGKSSTTEYLNAIFEQAGKKTALSNGIRFKIAQNETRNTTRMSTPGRFGLQKFLRDAVDARCDIAIIEMTSEGAAQHRHRFIDLDMVIFTNLAPEHIESHGSLEAYIDAKLSIGRQLLRSQKRPRTLVLNESDPVSARFAAIPVDAHLSFSLAALPAREPQNKGGTNTFEFNGVLVSLQFPGDFSVLNALAAATAARAFSIDATTIARGLSALACIPGRAEKIDAGQPFSVYVDYAHNPSSLQALFSSFPEQKKICIIGATGGGRDSWKRPEMGRIASELCDITIITNEDPYDEDPKKIVEAIASGCTHKQPIVCIDRKEAIQTALSLAGPGDVVLITGKGTDPNIKGPRGSSIPWSDRDVATEELHALVAAETQNHT